MIFGTFIDVGIANICAMAATPNLTEIVPNSPEPSQLTYTAHGFGRIETSLGGVDCPEDTLVDLSAFKTVPLTGTAGPNGVIWSSINPRDGQEIDYTLLKGDTLLDFVGVSGTTILLCLRGIITANGKDIKSLNFAEISKDKQVSITVPQDCTAILFWLK